MRIGVSGSHAVGKSALVDALSAAMPAYEVAAEPYEHLIESGYIFGDPPRIDDFAVQMQWSLESVTRTRGYVIYDRTPADFLAYLTVLQERGRSSEAVDYWSVVVSALSQLDLIVYVPIEESDRMEVPAAEYPKLRRRVDRMLRRLLVEDELGVAAQVVEVRGSVEARARQVLERLTERTE